MNLFRTCRACRLVASDLVKDGPRHYIHADCAMQKYGAAFFQRLTPWQASRFPVMIAARYRALEALEARVASGKREAA